MKFKKITAVILSFAMVLSGVAGMNLTTEEVQAAVPSTLPSVSGLYMAEYMDWENEKVKTDTDAAGNMVLANGEGEMIRYRDQDNPEYLTTGISEGWGFGFDNNDEKWFDYIADGTVTHVNPSDLVITHLDGTPCNEITVTAHEQDARVAIFHVNELEPVKITYQGAELNNTIIATFALRTGLYTSETMSLESQITGDVNVVEGKSKEFYLHLTDDWEEAGFRFDPADAVTIRYWDEDSSEDVELSGTDAEEYVTITPVSENDPHHLIYQVAVQGKNTSESGYELKFHYTEYNQNDESDTWDEERNFYIRITEYALCGRSGYFDGKRRSVCISGRCKFCKQYLLWSRKYHKCCVCAVTIYR